MWDKFQTFIKNLLETYILTLQNLPFFAQRSHKFDLYTSITIELTLYISVFLTLSLFIQPKTYLLNFIRFIYIQFDPFRSG